jgi:hypothetical protein
MLLIFVLSFFGWHVLASSTLQPKVLDQPASLWGLLGADMPQFMAYTAFLFFGIVLTATSMVFEKQWFGPPPPPLAALIMWKDLIVGLFLSIGFLILAGDYVQTHFVSIPNPMLPAQSVVVRLHLLAVLASFLMFWLHWRKMRNAPLPSLEMRW